MKNNLIIDIVSELIDKIGTENTKIVKELLELKLSNVEMKPIETSLIVYNGKIENTIKKFIAVKKIQGLTDRTLNAYLNELKLFFNQINKNVEDIIVDDIRIYLAICRKKSSNVTIDNKRRYLNSFFDWCTLEEIISKNPVRRIEKIKCTKKVKEAFTDMEIEKMRNYLSNAKEIGSYKFGKANAKENKLRNIAIFETLLSTGARVAEVTNIQLTHIDFDKNEILVLGKGNKERIVYLNAKSRIAIDNYLKERNDNFPYLFISHNVNTNEIQKISLSYIEAIIRNVGKKLGIKSHPHKFRRTAATMAVSKGMPIEQVQKLLGHATLSTTQIYVRVQEEEVKNSHNKYFN